MSSNKAIKDLTPEMQSIMASLSDIVDKRIREEVSSRERMISELRRGIEALSQVLPAPSETGPEHNEDDKVAKASFASPNRVAKRQGAVLKPTPPSVVCVCSHSFASLTCTQTMKSNRDEKGHLRVGKRLPRVAQMKKDRRAEACAARAQALKEESRLYDKVLYNMSNYHLCSQVKHRHIFR